MKHLIAGLLVVSFSHFVNALEVRGFDPSTSLRRSSNVVKAGWREERDKDLALRPIRLKPKNTSTYSSNTKEMEYKRNSSKEILKSEHSSDSPDDGCVLRFDQGKMRTIKPGSFMILDAGEVSGDGPGGILAIFGAKTFSWNLLDEKTGNKIGTFACDNDVMKDVTKNLDRALRNHFTVEFDANPEFLVKPEEDVDSEDETDGDNEEDANNT